MFLLKRKRGKSNKQDKKGKQKDELNSSSARKPSSSNSNQDAAQLEEALGVSPGVIERDDQQSTNMSKGEDPTSTKSLSNPEEIIQDSGNDNEVAEAPVKDTPSKQLPRISSSMSSSTKKSKQQRFARINSTQDRRNTKLVLEKLKHALEDKVVQNEAIAAVAAQTTAAGTVPLALPEQAPLPPLVPIDSPASTESFDKSPPLFVAAHTGSPLPQEPEHQQQQHHHQHQDRRQQQRQEPKQKQKPQPKLTNAFRFLMDSMTQCGVMEPLCAVGVGGSDGRRRSSTSVTAGPDMPRSVRMQWQDLEEHEREAQMKMLEEETITKPQLYLELELAMTQSCSTAQDNEYEGVTTPQTTRTMERTSTEDSKQPQQQPSGSSESIGRGQATNTKELSGGPHLQERDRRSDDNVCKPESSNTFLEMEPEEEEVISEAAANHYQRQNQQHPYTSSDEEKNQVAGGGGASEVSKTAEHLMKEQTHLQQAQNYNSSGSMQQTFPAIPEDEEQKQQQQVNPYLQTVSVSLLIEKEAGEGTMEQGVPPVPPVPPLMGAGKEADEVTSSLYQNTTKNSVKDMEGASNSNANHQEDRQQQLVQQQQNQDQTNLSQQRSLEEPTTDITIGEESSHLDGLTLVSNASAAISMYSIGEHRIPGRPRRQEQPRQQQNQPRVSNTSRTVNKEKRGKEQEQRNPLQQQPPSAEGDNVFLLDDILKDLSLEENTRQMSFEKSKKKDKKHSSRSNRTENVPKGSTTTVLTTTATMALSQEEPTPQMQELTAAVLVQPTPQIQEFTATVLGHHNDCIAVDDDDDSGTFMSEDKYFHTEDDDDHDSADLRELLVPQSPLPDPKDKYYHVEDENDVHDVNRTASCAAPFPVTQESSHQGGHDYNVYRHYDNDEEETSSVPSSHMVDYLNPLPLKLMLRPPPPQPRGEHSRYEHNRDIQEQHETLASASNKITTTPLMEEQFETSKDMDFCDDDDDNNNSVTGNKDDYVNNDDYFSSPCTSTSSQSSCSSNSSRSSTGSSCSRSTGSSRSSNTHSSRGTESLYSETDDDFDERAHKQHSSHIRNSSNSNSSRRNKRAVRPPNPGW